MVREVLTDEAPCEPRLAGAEGTRRYLKQEWVRPGDHKLSVQGGNGPAGSRTARMSAWRAQSDGRGCEVRQVTGARVGLLGPCRVWAFLWQLMDVRIK